MYIADLNDIKYNRQMYRNNLQFYIEVLHSVKFLLVLFD